MHRAIWLVPTLCLSCSLPAAAQSERTALQELVVSATASEESLRDAPAAMSVIGRDSLLERPVRDLLDAVRETPGITMTSTGFTRKSIHIRGMDHTHTLFLVDGRRVNASADVIAHSDFELGWIPSEAIRQIEVVRGPMSALYGSEALGGVINVLTRPVTDTWTGSSSVSFGRPAGPGGRELQVGAYAAGPVVAERLGVRLFVDRATRHQTPDSADPVVSAIEGRRSASGGGTLSWTPAEAHRLDLSVQRAEDTRRRDTRTSGPPHLSVAEEFRDDITRQQLDLQYRGDFQDYGVETGVYRSTLDRVNTRTVGDASAPQKLTDDIAEARLRASLGRHALLIGGELRREQLDDGALVVTGSERVSRQALYLQDRLTLPVEDVSLTLGIRADRHEEFGTAYSPRAYLVWHAREDLTLRGGYGEAFKAPTLKQLSTQFSTFGGGGRFEVTGNPDLKPETSRNAELGVLYATPLLRMEATVFDNRLRDLVQTACTDSCGLFGVERRTYVNVAEARIRGLELGGGVELPLGFEADASYTQLATRDAASGQRLMERPRHSAAGRLGWRNGVWSAQLRAQRIGSQYGTVGQNRERLPHYTLLHVGASLDVTPDVTLRLGVENLADQRLSERSEHFGYDERRRFVYVASNVTF